MNRTELIDKIAEGSELSKAAAKKALDATLEAVKNALVEGDKIQLIGFGTFSVSERPARENVKNSLTGKITNIPAKKVVKFKPGSELAESVNK